MRNMTMKPRVTAEKEVMCTDSIRTFADWLRLEERSAGTIEKYVRDVHALLTYLNERPITRENVAEWKLYLLKNDYRPATVNSMLASINTYCRYVGIECRIKLLRIQQRIFREETRELTKSEYERLIKAAHNNRKERLELLIETIGGTGIRVSEVKYLTVENVTAGRFQIMLKGTCREIMMPKKLRRKLLDYAKRQKITAGEIFITKTGNGVSRKQIWAEMKALCRTAGVAPSKVFPHNLRHLFARVFYKITKDVAKLSDLLGHSSIETTRIYLRSSGTEHAREIERMGLIS